MMRKTPPKILSWITILLLSLLIFIILCNIKYTKYLNLKGTLIERNGEKYVQILMETNISNITKENSLEINGKKYKNIEYNKDYMYIKTEEKNLRIKYKTTLMKEIKKGIQNGIN